MVDSHSDDDNTLLTIQEASDLLGVSFGTLRRWDKEEHLTAVRLYPRSPRRYRRSDVLALMGSDEATA